MNKNEFEQRWSEGSGMTVGEVDTAGLVAVRCGCGEAGCPGWQMVAKTMVPTLKSLAQIPEEPV